MTRAGRTEEQESERTCIVTRRARAPSDMLRFVLGPDDVVVPDLKRNLPGRGVWVSAEKAHVAEAARRQLFAKGFKATARASASLADEVDRLLERDALQSLSIANKAGLVTTGAAKIEKTIAAGPIAGMVHAADGAPDGVRKMGQALRRAYGDAAAQAPRVILFSSSQLDLALGRSNVIHAALKSGPASGAFLERCRRLAHYRGETGAPGAQDNMADSRGPGADGAVVEAGADDRNQRGGGPDHCHQQQPERGSGDDVTTSGRGPGIETI